MFNKVVEVKNRATRETHGGEWGIHIFKFALTCCHPGFRVVVMLQATFNPADRALVNPPLFA
jgi:hypothetical protein